MTKQEFWRQALLAVLRHPSMPTDDTMCTFAGLKADRALAEFERRWPGVLHEERPGGCPGLREEERGSARVGNTGITVGAGGGAAGAETGVAIGGPASDHVCNYAAWSPQHGGWCCVQCGDPQ